MYRWVSSNPKIYGQVSLELAVVFMFLYKFTSLEIGLKKQWKLDRVDIPLRKLYYTFCLLPPN